MIALAFVCVASWAPGARPGARWCPPVSRPALPSATARFGRVLALGDGEHANAVEPVDSSVAQQPVAAGAMTTQQALTQTAIAVLAAVAFGIGVAATRGYADASAWFTAYVLEESLSIDNLFVFSLIFDYFKTPASAQPRVLKWGLIVAVVLRAAFITGGLAAVERFKGVLLLFAGVLIYSACGLLFEEKGEDEDLSQNAVILFAKEYLPWPTSDAYDGDSFFTTSADGLQRLATPLLLALVCVELSVMHCPSRTHKHAHTLPTSHAYTPLSPEEEVFRLFTIRSCPVRPRTGCPLCRRLNTCRLRRHHLALHRLHLQCLRAVRAARTVHAHCQRRGPVPVPSDGDRTGARLYWGEARPLIWRVRVERHYLSRCVHDTTTTLPRHYLSRCVHGTCHPPAAQYPAPLQVNLQPSCSYEIPTEASLLIVLGTLSGGVGASIVQRAAATKEVGAAAELNDDSVDES